MARALMRHAPLAAALALALAGCAATAARTPDPEPTPTPAARVPYAPEPWLTAAGREVEDAIRRYATVNGDRFPLAAEFPSELATYLPEVDLPAAPGWPDGVRQVRTLAIAPPLTPVGQPPAAVGTPLGPVRLPTADADFDARTHGAWLYGTDAARARYVLYGIGRAGGQAVVGYVGRG